jgi:putative glutamine amidotransferase
MKIAISKASGSPTYERYAAWLRMHSPELQIVDCVNLSAHEMREVLSSCHGLLLSGGADVEPQRYGSEAGSLPCSPDPERDAREFALLDIAFERRMPVLGICRGMQVLNVHGGGTLVIDIPQQHPSEVEHAREGGDAEHHVDVSTDSVLKKTVRVAEGMVNSSHHQAVELLAPGYTVAATAADGIIEAIERDPEQGTSVVLGVQWHPERMDVANPLSGAILHNFCFECDCYEHMIYPKLPQ